MAGAEGRVGAAAEAAMTALGANGVVVKKPLPNSVAIVDVEKGSNLILDFDLKSAQVKVVDVDLIVTFPDGARIVLPGLAFDIVANSAPKIFVGDQLLPHNELVALLPSVKLMDPPILQVITDTQSQQDTHSSDADNDKSADHTNPQAMKLEAPRKLSLEEIQTAPLVKPQAGPGVSSLTATASSTNTSSTDFTDYGNDKVAILKVQMLGYTEHSTTALTPSLTRVEGASAEAGAATDKSFGAQSAREAVTGTVGNDIIYADRKAGLEGLTSTRVIDVVGEFPSGGWTASAVRVSGLPAGFEVENATKAAGGAFFLVPMTKDDPNHVQLILTYKLPEDGATKDTDGYYSKFALTLTYEIESGGKIIKATGSQQFAIGDPTSDATMVVVDPITQKNTYVLFATPPGNIVNAGSGDDTIHAGIGSDVINGGDGNDVVSYENSKVAVSVDLATGSGQGGYAAADTLTGIEGIYGSAFADTLKGDANDNTFVGGAGADIIQGAGGNDTGDYSSSKTGVTVDLLTGRGYGGDAQGDSLTGIEYLVGSSYADSLVGDATNNVLKGGVGDDTISGGLGADLIDGGEGLDVVDYSRSGSAITIDLNTSVQTQAGEPNGDTLVSVEGVIGTALNDSLVGTIGANWLDGGAGADTMVGGLGNDIYTVDDAGDVIVDNAGEGTDTVRVTFTTYALGSGADIENLTFIGTGDFNGVGSSTANVITGAAGNDTLTGGAGNDTFLYTRGDGSDTVAGGSDFDVLELFTTATHYARGNAQGAGVDFVVALGGSTYSTAAVSDGVGGWNLDLVWGANTSGTVTFSDGGVITIDNTLERIHW